MCQYMHMYSLCLYLMLLWSPRFLNGQALKNLIGYWALRRRFHSLVPLCWKIFLTREWVVFYQITMILFVPSLVRKSLSPLSSLSRASVPLCYISILSVKLWARRLPVGNSLNEATNVTSEPFFGLLSLNTFTSMLHGLPSHRGHLKNAPKARVRAPPLVDLCNRYYLKVNLA